MFATLTKAGPKLTDVGLGCFATAARVVTGAVVEKGARRYARMFLFRHLQTMEQIKFDFPIPLSNETSPWCPNFCGSGPGRWSGRWVEFRYDRDGGRFGGEEWRSEMERIGLNWEHSARGKKILTIYRRNERVMCAHLFDSFSKLRAPNSSKTVVRGHHRIQRSRREDGGPRANETFIRVICPWS